MTISNETKVGVLAILAITSLVLGFDFLKGNNTFDRGRTYYVIYPEIQGLQESNPIRINGAMIGRVKTVTLLDDYRILARLTVTDPVEIPRDSRAIIAAPDLLGTKMIDLRPGTSAELARSGDTLIGSLQPGIQELIQEQLAPIQESVQTLLAQLDSSVVAIDQMFGGSTPDNIERSFTSISDALSNFSRTSQRIDDLIRTQTVTVDSIFGNLKDVTGAIATNQDQIDRLLNNLANLSDTLAEAPLASTVSETRDAIRNLSNIVGALEEGQGSLGKLLIEEGLYDNLEASSRELDLLLQDLQENPSRYVTLLRIGGGKAERKRAKEQEEE